MEYYDFTQKQLRATDVDEMDARVHFCIFGKEEDFIGCSGVRYFKNRYTVKSEAVYIGRNSGFEVAEGGEAWNIEEDYDTLLSDDEITLPEESWLEALRRLEYGLENTRPMPWGDDFGEFEVGNKEVNFEVFIVDTRDDEGYFMGYLNKNFSASGRYACFRPDAGRMIRFFKDGNDPRYFKVVWYDKSKEEDVQASRVITISSPRGIEPGPAEPEEIVRHYHI